MSTKIIFTTLVCVAAGVAFGRIGPRGEIARTDQVTRDLGPDNEGRDPQLMTTDNVILDNILVDFDKLLNDIVFKQGEHEGLLDDLTMQGAIKVIKDISSQGGNVYYDKSSNTYKISFPRTYASLSQDDMPAFTGIYANGPGTIALWPSDKAPNGWFPCDGTRLCSAEYPDLFAIIGHEYDRAEDFSGENGGAAHCTDPAHEKLRNHADAELFRVPNYKGFSLVGKDGKGLKDIDEGGDAERFDQSAFINQGTHSIEPDLRVGAYREAGVADENYGHNTILMRPPLMLVNYIIRHEAEPLFGFSAVELYPSTNYVAKIENNVLKFWYKAGISGAAAATKQTTYTGLSANEGGSGSAINTPWITCKEASFVSATGLYAVGNGQSDYRHKPLLDILVKPPNGAQMIVGYSRQGNASGNDEYAFVNAIVPNGWSYKVRLSRLGSGWTSKQSLTVNETTLE